MKIKKILCTLLSAVMLIVITPSVGATSVSSSKVPEAPKVGKMLIRTFELEAEVYNPSNRMVIFSGCTDCIEVIDEVGFLNIKIEKLYGDTWYTFDTIYGNDIEYNKSKCTFRHFYSFPIMGHYRVSAVHYARDSSFFFGESINRVPNSSNFIFVI